MFGIPNSPRSLDLDDRQGFIASSAMQQKKKLRPQLAMWSPTGETSLDAGPSRALQVQHSRWWSTAHHGMDNPLLDFLTCHLCLVIALACVGCLTISASQGLPPAIFRVSALLDFKVLALVTVAFTTLASHLGIQSFPLFIFTISPAFPKAFWT